MIRDNRLPLKTIILYELCSYISLTGFIVYLSIRSLQCQNQPTNPLFYLFPSSLPLRHSKDVIFKFYNCHIMTKIISKIRKRAISSTPSTIDASSNNKHQKPHKNFIFNLQIHNCMLKIYRFRLKTYKLNLKTDFSMRASDFIKDATHGNVLPMNARHSLIPAAATNDAKEVMRRCTRLIAVSSHIATVATSDVTR